MFTDIIFQEYHMFIFNNLGIILISNVLVSDFLMVSSRQISCTLKFHSFRFSHFSNFPVI